MRRLHDYIWRLWAKRRLAGRVTWGIYWYFIVLPVRIFQVAGSRPILEWIARRVFGKPVVLHIDDAL